MNHLYIQYVYTISEEIRFTYNLAMVIQANVLFICAVQFWYSNFVRVSPPLMHNNSFYFYQFRCPFYISLFAHGCTLHKNMFQAKNNKDGKVGLTQYVQKKVPLWIQNQRFHVVSKKHLQQPNYTNRKIDPIFNVDGNWKIISDVNEHI